MLLVCECFRKPSHIMSAITCTVKLVKRNYCSCKMIFNYVFQASLQALQSLAQQALNIGHGSMSNLESIKYMQHAALKVIINFINFFSTNCIVYCMRHYICSYILHQLLQYIRICEFLPFY